MSARTRGFGACRTAFQTATSMRVLASLAVIAGAVASSGDARGGDAPGFSDLPVGRFTAPPKKKVDFVSAREAVPGIFVVAPQHVSTLPVQHRYVSITTSARSAAAARQGGGLPDEEPSACITEMHRMAIGTEEKDLEWEENHATEAHAYPRTGDNPMSGVIAVHTERVVEQNGSVTLESVDAWVDPQTRGARLIAKGSIPLKLVRTPAFGMKVYAGRDERPDGKRFVQFVVVRPPAASNAASRATQMWAMRQDGDVVHSSGCPHQRVAIPVEGKGGDTATVVATVVLPKLDASGKEQNEQKDTPAPAPPPAKPKPRKVFFPGKLGGEMGSGKESEVRSRMMHIQVSVSQTAREKEPLVSVSSSWGGREQVDRVFEPETPVL